MKPQIKWALAAAAVLLVGLISLQQTGALWRSEANSAGGGTITAGELRFSAGTQNFDLSDLGMENAAPGDSVQKALPVINDGNVTMAYSLNGVAVNGVDGSDAIPMTVRVAAVANEGACTPTGDVGDVLVDNAPNAATFGPRNVAAGKREVLCIRVTLAQNAGLSKKSKATFTFGANSVSGA